MVPAQYNNIVAESLGAAGQGGLRMDTGCQSLLSVHHGNTFIVLQPQLYYNNIGLLKCLEMSDSLTHVFLSGFCLAAPIFLQSCKTKSGTESLSLRLGMY